MRGRPASRRRSSRSPCARPCWWWSWGPRGGQPPSGRLPEGALREAPREAEQGVLEGVGEGLAVDDRSEDAPRPADGVAEDDHVPVARVLVAAAHREGVARAGRSNRLLPGWAVSWKTWRRTLVCARCL